jgi:hypothetical protein
MSEYQYYEFLHVRDEQVGEQYVPAVRHARW